MLESDRVTFKGIQRLQGTERIQGEAREKQIFDTLQFGLDCAKILETCPHCKDKLLKKYGGISESNQILLESKGDRPFETTPRK